MTLMAIDLGTSSVKVTITDHRTGEVIASGSGQYPLLTKRPGWVEQAPDDWWSAAKSAIRQCLGQYRGEPSSIRGIGFSGQMCGIIPVNRQGEPLYHCITYLDTRCVEEIDLLKKRESDWIKSGMNPVSNLLSAPKLLWLRRNHPDLWNQTYKWLMPKDFLRFKLTGTFGTDITDASGTLFMDFASKEWNPAVEEFGLDLSRFPAINRPDEVVGYVTEEAAQETGLHRGTPVVAGGADMACTALGTRALQEGYVSITIGTAGHVIAPIKKADVKYSKDLYQFCHAVPDMYYAFGAVYSGGLSLSWFKDILCGIGGNPADQDIYAILNAEAKKAQPGASGVFFLPFLTGSGIPYSDAQAKGGFIGLTVRHTSGDMIRAVMEGVSYNFKQIIETLERWDIPVTNFFLGEGGSKSPLWAQIVTSAINRGSIGIMRNKDSAPLGAAILAGIGVGLYRDWNEAANQLTAFDQIKPDPDWARKYKEGFHVYEQLYPALRDVFQQIHKLEEPL
jgi:xylulokinase